MKNGKTIGIIAIVIIAILLVGGYLVFSSGPVVAAQGKAVITVIPDVVSININIETRNNTAQLAQDMNKQIRSQLTAQLTTLGFNDSELQFVNYNVYPEYDYSNDYYSGYPKDSKIKGYVASQQLVVKTKSVDKVPGVIDSAISAGSLVSYINFEISDSKQSEIKRNALEQASQNAKRQAESIAKGQGKKLGALVSIQNMDTPMFQPYNYYSAPVAAGMMMDKATIESTNAQTRSAAISISPQEQTIEAGVTAQYRLGGF